MADDLKSAMAVAGSGMQVQSARIKVVAQNIANADSTALSPGGKPYQRKTISFKNEYDKALGVDVVQVNKVGTDPSDFIKVYSPGHPAADAQGYILKANIRPEIEKVDMMEAQRSYEANLSTIEVTKTMLNRTLEMLR